MTRYSHSFKVLVHKCLVKYKRKHKSGKKKVREIWQKPALKGDQREYHPQWDNPCHVLPKAMPSREDAAWLYTCVMANPEREAAQIQRHSTNYVVLLFTNIKAIYNNKIKKRLRNIRKGKKTIS